MILFLKHGEDMVKCPLYIWFLIGVVLIFPSVSFADIPGLSNTGIFSDVASLYKTNAAAWASRILNFATTLFFTLATISLTWTFGLLALRQADIAEYFLELVRFSMPLGLFYWLLVNGSAIGQSIFDSFSSLGGTASGLGTSVNASSIVDVGFYVFNSTLNVIRDDAVGYIDAFVMFVLSLIIFWFILEIAIELLLLNITAWLVIYAGVILLGFGGGKWFNDIAIGYYRKVLSLGVEYFGLIVLVGLGAKFVDDFLALAKTNANGLGASELVMLFVTTFILFRLTQIIPKTLGSIVGAGHHFGSGIGGSGSIGSMMHTASSSIASLTVAASMLSEAAKSLAANTGGAASMAHAAMTAGRSPEGASVNAAHDAVANSTESLARSTNPAKALAAGIAAVTGNKVDSFKERIGNRIGETIPGQIANEIRRQGASGGGDGNSFSAGATQASSSQPSSANRNRR